MNVYQELKRRGAVHQTSNEAGVEALLREPGATFYCGFDPTAESLQLGNLLVIMTMSRLQRAGHRAIYLVGGGTGLIGDPSGKQEMRKELAPETVAANAAKIRAQVEDMGLLYFHKDPAIEIPAMMVNNYEWLSGFTFLQDFMMKVARAFSVKEMVKMETFAKRLADESAGLTLTEFLYPVLQAWDFLWLFEQYDCRIQVGGKDQWGNILQGIDLVRRTKGKEVFALTFPLLTTSGGQKMGKSEKGTIWLDPEMTPPWEFYQYLRSLPDELVEQMLPLYTFLPMEEIDDILEDPREAQIRLAYEVTKIVHGKETAEAIQADAKRVRGNAEGDVKEIPTFTIPPEGMRVRDILSQSESTRSKSQADRLCEQRAVWKQGEKNTRITDSYTEIKGSCIIRYGKGKFLHVEARED